MNYTIDDINDYMNRLTEDQKIVLITHCNKNGIFPEICAWYDDMKDFYQDWVYDHDICPSEKEAKERYKDGLESGEFLKFKDGQIIRLTL